MAGSAGDTPGAAPDSGVGLTEEEKPFDTNADDKLDEEEQAAYDAAQNKGADGDPGVAPGTDGGAPGVAPGADGGDSGGAAPVPA